MKFLTCLILLTFSSLCLAQGEANNWFFGQFAGIRFNNDGTVTPLPGSQLTTNEGCSTMSDQLGNLLFYTDGRNVWDRNHIKMPNGNYNLNTGLLGDPSSTQSAIIVPKKDDPNIYYIITVDEPHHENAAVFPAQFPGPYPEPNGTFGTIPDADDGFNNGLNYSIVDLSVTGTNGSIGDITTRNVQLLTYDPANPDEAKYKCSEKITAVKNSDGSGYWVISQFLDNFYAFRIDSSGINTNPVVTQIVPLVTQNGYRRNSIGYLKASPDGTKLAIAHMQRGTTEGGTTSNGAVYLYDFDDATGIVSNPVLVRDNVNPYGIEFSPEAKKLYVTYNTNALGDGGLRQYDLLSANIGASEVMISSGVEAGALQLGPNGKIYHAAAGLQALGVINAPEDDGFACNFQPASQPVAISGFERVTLGLPPFITSIFSATIVTQNTCLGSPTDFELNANTSFDSVVWNFGDGNSSTLNEPQHTYTATGLYTVIANITKDGTTTQFSKQVTISAVPVANAAQNITECDTDNDERTNFNLTQNTALIIGVQSSSTFEVKYFTTQENADDNTAAIANPSFFTNTINPQRIFARIQNKDNTSCYATTPFWITASGTPVINITSFEICDDAADGDDTNGRATFDFNAVTQQMVQFSGNFTTTYYANNATAQSESGPLPQFYTNINPNQEVIFARIVNTISPTCFTIQPVTLIVNPLPPVVNNAELVQCDLAVSPDGITQFNLSEADTQFTGGNTGLSVTYFASQADAQNNLALPNNYSNTVPNIEQVFAKVTNTQTGCERVLPLTLRVNSNATTPLMLQRCDDDGTEDGFAQFNLDAAGVANGTNTVTYYANATDALLEQNPVGSNYTNTTANQQSVYARVETNNACAAIQEIQLFVRPLPDIDIDGEGIVCLNTRDFITLDAALQSGNPNHYRYEWSTGSIARTISVNEPGVYTVKVIDTRFGTDCEKIRTITVRASDVATFDSVVINDLTDNNTVTVNVSPGNNVATTYLYSLDLPDGPYQESNFFENVTAGMHTIYVYDTQRCGVVSKEISVLAIPKFFTPNGDGVNETWNIIGVNALFYQNSKIYVFDRFGKLLADVNPKGPGWDGIHDGRALPATDYWYVVQLDNGRTVKGHFSLVR